MFDDNGNPITLEHRFVISLEMLAETVPPGFDDFTKIKGGAFFGMWLARQAPEVVDQLLDKQEMPERLRNLMRIMSAFVQSGEMIF